MYVVCTAEKLIWSTCARHLLPDLFKIAIWRDPYRDDMIQSEILIEIWQVSPYY